MLEMLITIFGTWVLSTTFIFEEFGESAVLKFLLAKQGNFQSVHGKLI